MLAHPATPSPSSRPALTPSPSKHAPLRFQEFGSAMDDILKLKEMLDVDTFAPVGVGGEPAPGLRQPGAAS